MCAQFHLQLNVVSAWLQLCEPNIITISVNVESFTITCILNVSYNFAKKEMYLLTHDYYIKLCNCVLSTPGVLNKSWYVQREQTKLNAEHSLNMLTEHNFILNDSYKSMQQLYGVKLDCTICIIRILYPYFQETTTKTMFVVLVLKDIFFIISIICTKSHFPHCKEYNKLMHKYLAARNIN